jgi:predicted TIM-barrel fold metal-dependent hydrolase
MIIDINAWIGRWPFRALQHNTAPELVALMDRKRIDKAIVSSLDAILYKNCQVGNEQLATEVAAYPDRLIPFATVNPTYADWRTDVIRCQEDLGMCGLRVFPSYHGYALEDESCAELMEVAAERGLPVAIPLRMEDRRQQHWMDTAPDLTPKAVGELVGRFPAVRFMILNGIGTATDWATLQGARAIVDISRLTNLRMRPGPHDSSIPGLIAALGVEKLAFGTGIPIKYPEPAFLKVEILDATREIKERIYWQNAAEMLGPELEQ